MNLLQTSLTLFFLYARSLLYLLEPRFLRASLSYTSCRSFPKKFPFESAISLWDPKSIPTFWLLDFFLASSFSNIKFKKYFPLILWSYTHFFLFQSLNFKLCLWCLTGKQIVLALFFPSLNIGVKTRMNSSNSPISHFWTSNKFSFSEIVMFFKSTLSLFR